VLADAELARERTHQHIRQVPRWARHAGQAWRRHMEDSRGRAQMRQAFPVLLYRCRSLAERVIAAVKRTRLARAPGRSLVTQCLQAWLLGVAYHVYRL
jgi:hypothetical protein